VHHLPRQLFGGKVHLLCLSIQFNRSILFQRERRAISFAVFDEVMREAKPAACDTKRDLVCADLDDCVMPAVKSVGGSIGAKQRRPGGPKFAVESVVDVDCLQGWSSLQAKYRDSLRRSE
jgi:hypothetical protein